MERTLSRRATIGKPQDVVVETVLLVPHTFRPRLIHGVGDPKEMIRKLHGHVFVERVVSRQLDGNFQHVLAEHGDPRGAVSLLKVATSGQRSTAVENADVVQPEEAAFKKVFAKTIFAVHPPTEIQHQLDAGGNWKRLLKCFGRVRGNHDRSGLDEPQAWWWRKWIDPTGEHTEFSHVDANKRAVSNRWNLGAILIPAGNFSS